MHSSCDENWHSNNDEPSNGSDGGAAQSNNGDVQADGGLSPIPEEGSEIDTISSSHKINDADIGESDGVAMRTLDKLKVDIPKLRNLILAYIEENQEEISKPNVFF